MTKKKFKDRKVGKLLIGLAKSKVAKFLIRGKVTRALTKIGLPIIGTPLIETLVNVNHVPEKVPVGNGHADVLVGPPHKSVNQQWIIALIIVVLVILWATGVITTEQLTTLFEQFVG